MPIWPPEPTDSGAYPFNPQETARLSVYRAAIAAGFYTDTLAPYARCMADTDVSRRSERSIRAAA
jgi:hypothetical protein